MKAGWSRTLYILPFPIPMRHLIALTWSINNGRDSLDESFPHPSPSFFFFFFLVDQFSFLSAFIMFPVVFDESN